MRLAALISAFLCMATSLAAQGWTAQVSRDGIYDAGRVSIPGSMLHIACAAETGQGRVTPESRWWEVSVAPPWQVLLDFADALVPSVQNQMEVDMVMFVDQTPYPLPPVSRNELEGGWMVFMPMTDPVFAAMAGASRIVLQVGSGTAWELPVQGLSDGLRQIGTVCSATWTARGIAAPSGLRSAAAPQTQGQAQLPPAIQAYADEQCMGVAGFKDGALQTGDLDGDGAADVVLDWGLVTCNGESMRGFCGAANCEYNVFLSSRGYAMASAHLAVGVQIAQHHSGRAGLIMGGTARVCSQIDCSVPWLWNGSKMVQVP